MSRGDGERLRDILGAIEAIDRARAAGQRLSEDLDAPAVVLAAIQFHVFTIGEAVKALSGTLTAERPEVPWSDIARMRDLIGHHYYKLDAQIVHATIGQPLKRLRDACHALLTDLDTDDHPTP
ncbi:HepT-like ribonuclease domain-containing protein [Actinotalea sp. K2]|uniref:HepT-like ribonuclease domain-containing protein n=1 Tax=Actinotalea sp. K2 TaxID=2939438 RepID=UPI0020177487|nr:HepT-like ribonuclease domain-containing protein [Actinotalea sp. K2]MCL3860655.1 DUF86 domain-containing protein [Actinotalea sp. K2]